MQLGGTILTGTPVEEILQDETGVRGVAARVNGQRTEFRATGGVVLAAGDYASSPQLIARFKGERFGQIEASVSWREGATKGRGLGCTLGT
jgi:phytoene dehydrogenase-like protein